MDALRLGWMLKEKKLSAIPEPELDDLEFELDRARVIDFPEIPTDLVTMNTKFKYRNITDKKEGIITIVYPQHSNSEEKKISIAAPLAAALIGLRENDEIEWYFPSGQIKRLKVLEILYQPEANGDLHL
jgi:regulator of nucleoside diphosphate kinase